MPDPSCFWGRQWTPHQDPTPGWMLDGYYCRPHQDGWVVTCNYSARKCLGATRELALEDRFGKPKLVMGIWWYHWGDGCYWAASWCPVVRDCYQRWSCNMSHYPTMEQACQASIQSRLDEAQSWLQDSLTTIQQARGFLLQMERSR